MHISKHALQRAKERYPRAYDDITTLPWLSAKTILASIDGLRARDGRRIYHDDCVLVSNNNVLITLYKNE